MNLRLSKKQFDIISLITILWGSVFLILRAPYGFFFNDEPFYLTLAQRLFLGDSLILNEWNAGQCVGALIYPIYALFHLFSFGNDGILLFMRYVYCILWFCTCLTVFLILRKKYHSSIFVFLYLILFSPLDYMTLSYTSLSLISIIAICLLFYYSFEHKHLQFGVFSIIFSLFSCILVLCYPFMVAVYIIGIPIAIILVARLKHKDAQEYGYWLKVLTLSIIIISIIAVIFLFSIIIRTNSVSEVIRKFSISIPFVFSSPEHGNVVSVASIFKTFLRIISFSRLYTLLIAFAIIFYFISKRIPNLKTLRFHVYLAVCAYYIICQIKICSNFDVISHNTLNQQVLGIVYLGLLSYLYLEKKPKKLLLCFVPASIIYSIITSLSSNTGIIVIAMSLSLCGIASIIFIAELLKQFSNNLNSTLFKIIPAIVLVVIMSVQIGSELYVRLSRFYWDAPMQELTERIEAGSGKGIFTTTENKEEYEKDSSALAALLNQLPSSDYSNERFLSLKSSPVLYLDANIPFGIYSAWSFRMTPDWLAQYYELNPECQATLIFTDEENDVMFSHYFNIEDFSVLEYDNYKLYYKETENE